MDDYCRYLTITPQQEKWGFCVTTAGHSKVYPNQSYPKNDDHPQSHVFTWNNGRILDAYYLVFIVRGKGIFESSATSPQSIEEGTCFFLFPGVWHRYKPVPDHGWEEYWVGFKGAYPELLVANGFFTPDEPCCRLSANENVLSLFQQLISTIRFSKFSYQQVISGITMQLLGLVSELSKHIAFETDQDTYIIEKAKFLMQENIENTIPIKDIIKELLVSYPAFRKTFKRITGSSPNQYYLHLRLKKAIELINCTNLSLKEIAFMTGFDSQFYFSKFFKKKFGTSPNYFRRNNLDKYSNKA